MDVDAKVEAISDFIHDNYDIHAYLESDIYLRRGDEVFEVYFYPEKLSCEGEITFNKDCQIANAEGTVLANAALRERTIRCEFDNSE